jgi:phosphoadenosine phosphosulfate reductase
VTEPEGKRLAADAALALADASADEIVAWAVDAFGDRLCVTTSMADAVVVDLVSRIRPGIPVIFLDTGYHFPETLETAHRVRERYPIRLETVRPALSVREQDLRHGAALYAREPDRCCHLRKVLPLADALRPYAAWVTGLRRDESPTRQHIGVVEWDAARNMVKVNPLASWTQDDVERYVIERDVVMTPLVASGYPSIGCAPCTAAVLPGADTRSGSWAGTDKIECGLHLADDGRLTRATG